MDFVFGLSLCKGVNVIIIVMDRAAQQVTLIPMHERMTTAGAAYLFLQWVVQCYGMPQEVIADRDPHFISVFWW